MELLSQELITQISGLVALYGPYVLIPLMMIEAPLMTIGAGFLVGAGVMSLPMAIFVYAVADLVGTHIYFYVGRGGSAFLSSIREKIQARQSSSGFLSQFREWASKELDENYNWTYALGKLLPLPYTTITVTVLSGALGISYKRFIRILLPLIPIQGIIFLTIGYLLAQGFLFELTPLRILGLIAVAAIAILLWISREFFYAKIQAFSKTGE